MRKLTLFSILLSAMVGAILATAANAVAADSALMGDQNVEATASAAAAGTAEAFEYTAVASGATAQASVYIDSCCNSATQLQVGLYSDNSGAPGTLLASGSTSSITTDSWTTVMLPTVSVTQGQNYWIALLGTGGQVGYSARWSADCPSSAQTGLSSLPSSWSSSSDGYDCASVYISGMLVGDQAVEPTASAAAAGTADAFEYTAVATGATDQANVYIDSCCNSATQLQVGLYSDNSGAPGTLLASGSTSSITTDSWTTVTLPTVSVTQGQNYWIALLGTGGQVGYSARWSTDCPSSAQTGLSSLPSSWSSSSDDYGCASVYLSGDSAVPPSNTALPTISGTSQEGNTLTADPGSWSGDDPLTYSYRWQDCTSSGCVNISGATSATYALTASDVGDAIDVVVTATNDAGSESATSAQTGAVEASSNPPSDSVLPVVTGNTLDGETLSATTGSWTNGPSSYAYQWKDCIGPTCTDIAGATSSSYTIQSSDVGYSLATVVTAANSVGSASATSFHTAGVPSGSSSSLISATYLLGFSPPSGCSSLTAACVTTTNPLNWNAVNQVRIFTLEGDAPATDATTTATVSGAISSIPASVTTAIPAGPIMLSTSSSTASNPSAYQILETSGAASGATSIPVTGSPTANYSYPSGSVVISQGLDSSSESAPTGSTLTNLVSAIHSHGAKALIAIGGADDSTWSADCSAGAFGQLLGAALAQYIVANDLDGVEIDEEQGTASDYGACWNAIGEEVHAVATYAGQVPLVTADINQSLGASDYYTAAAASETQVDFFTTIYYGFNPANDYSCADSCSSLASWLSAVDGDPYNIPAGKWVAGQGVAGAGGAAQEATTVLATASSSVSGAVTSVPVSALAAALPQGTFVLATADGLPPTHYEVLQTSGAASGATSIPVTGYCTVAGWTYGSGNCVSTSSVTLNATYASGSDIYLDLTGYPTGSGLNNNSSTGDYNVGGWDCGNNAAYAAAHGLLGVMEWFDDGSGNTDLCFDQIQPFVSGGFG